MAEKEYVSEELEEERRTVATNSVYSFSRSISRFVLSFIVSIFLVRVLGAQNYGLYSLVVIYWTVFEGLSTFGIDGMISYAVARYRAQGKYSKLKWVVKHYFYLIVVTSIVLSFVMFISANIISYFYNLPQMAYLLKILSVGLVFYVIADRFIPNIFQGFQKMKYTLIAGVTLDALRGVQVVVVVIGFGLVGAIAFYDITYAIIAAISIYFLYSLTKNIKSYSIPSKNESKRLMHYSVFTYESMLMFLVSSPMITLLLGYFAFNTSYVSFFRVANLMSGIIYMPMGALGSAFFATITKYFVKKDYTNFYALQNTLIRYSALSVIPLVVASIIASNQIIEFFYRSAMSSAVIPFIILLIPIAISSVFGPIVIVLSAIGKQKYFMYSNLAATIVSIVASITLIPMFLSEGAAIVSMAVSMSALFTNLYFTSKYIKIRLPIIAILKSIFSTGIMGIYTFLLLAITPLIMLPLVLISAITLYVFILYFVKAITDKDIKFILRLSGLGNLLRRYGLYNGKS